MEGIYLYTPQSWNDNMKHGPRAPGKILNMVLSNKNKVLVTVKSCTEIHIQRQFIILTLIHKYTLVYFRYRVKAGITVKDIYFMPRIK